ncbi:hypothetical protein MSAN_00899500 [Mycena sanguinolenta]|uniref:Uncharacterized protein n=1 Tax=Mycena sanguinolenta TaxID=230812 RepID=A0A8H6YY58_9AGAR|nr:hypothetical protein MSAN_00899500 [Mycena sanguinolenta]
MRLSELFVYVLTSLTLELTKSTLRKVDLLSLIAAHDKALAVWFSVKEMDLAMGANPQQREEEDYIFLSLGPAEAAPATPLYNTREDTPHLEASSSPLQGRDYSRSHIDYTLNIVCMSFAFFAGIFLRWGAPARGIPIQVKQTVHDTQERGPAAQRQPAASSASPQQPSDETSPTRSPALSAPVSPASSTPPTISPHGTGRRPSSLFREPAPNG